MLELTDCLKGLQQLESNSIDCIITSPPYNKKGLMGGKSIGNQIWQKFNIDYNRYDDNMTEDSYSEWLTTILDECHRVIKDDGSIFFNHKPRRHQNRCYLPSELIQTTQAKLYQLIIWDRKTSPNIRNDVLVPSTEHIYWYCKKKPRVYRDNIDREYIREVWTITPDKQKEHPAPFTRQVVENCIKLSTLKNDIVLDIFAGIGTTLNVAESLGRQALGFEIDSHYVDIYNQSVTT